MACEKVTDLKCATCGDAWTPQDVSIAERCPNCGNYGASAVRCNSCRFHHIEYLRVTTAAGHLLNRVMDLDFDTSRFAVDTALVPEEERMGLRILTEERDRHNRDKDKERRNSQEQQDMVVRARQNTSRV